MFNFFQKNKEQIPKKVGVICVGNICRSPVAEYLLKNLIKNCDISPIKDIQFDSAGLHGGKLELAKLSKEYLKKKKIEYSDFSSKRVSRYFIEDHAKIYVMEDWQKEFILKRYFGDSSYLKKRKIEKKINLMSSKNKKVVNIRDPYLLTEKSFFKILKMIEISCESLIKH